jgi:hypothetical protein
MSLSRIDRSFGNKSADINLGDEDATCHNVAVNQINERVNGLLGSRSPNGQRNNNPAA